MSIPSWAKPGQKVVCLNSDWRKGDDTPLWLWVWLKATGLPVAGCVYTISSVRRHPFDGGAALRLKGWGVIGFHVEWFRPLVSTKTESEDVALIKSLIDQPHLVDA